MCFEPTNERTCLLYFELGLGQLSVWITDIKIIQPDIQQSNNLF